MTERYFVRHLLDGFSMLQTQIACCWWFPEKSMFDSASHSSFAIWDDLRIELADTPSLLDESWLSWRLNFRHYLALTEGVEWPFWGSFPKWGGINYFWRLRWWWWKRLKRWCWARLKFVVLRKIRKTCSWRPGNCFIKIFQFLFTYHRRPGRL